ncbi:MAG: adenosylcobinamide kinase [Lachnospiraceae bacterium]|jgi:adenosylcobinamide kinase/adenosylcobinamide-phosphate guanylyltransferase|nr:adenosylcobinamide kinase [Lachnospiraceae bacterium]
MITVVIGGSGSGKSQYAEQLLVHTKAKYLYYLATMEIHGEEEKQKVERHKRMRRDKNFVTIERPRDLAGVEIMSPEEESAVLVECISNLTANEFFSWEGGASEENIRLIEAKIIHGLTVLASQAKDLIIVTNDVFCDGGEYTGETMEYMKLLGRINQKLCAIGDRAAEVVCGIPVALKGELEEME